MPTGSDAEPADRGEPRDLGDADAAADIPADSGPAPGMLGAACTADIECNGSKSICYYEDAYLIRGGYCSSFCDPQRAGSCGADGVCVNFRCARRCQNVSDCRPGQQCAAFFTGEASTVTVCTPGSPKPVPAGRPCTLHSWASPRTCARATSASRRACA